MSLLSPMPSRDPRLPFVERPWLLIHAIALALGIGGTMLWRAQAIAPPHTQSIVGVAVAMYISIAVLLAPSLCLRAARQSMGRLDARSRSIVLMRLFAAATVGPLSVLFLWAALGGNGWWMSSDGDEVRAMIALSVLLGLASAAGLTLQQRGRPN